MQITLDQNEIEAAIVKFVGEQGISITGKVEVTLTAGRGEKGITASIDISNETSVTIASQTAANTSAKSKPAKKEPVSEPVPKKEVAPEKEPEPETEPETEEAADEAKPLFGQK